MKQVTNFQCRCICPWFIYMAMYGTALVQCREYTRATRVVAACGPRVYSHDTQIASNL